MKDNRSHSYVLLLELALLARYGQFFLSLRFSSALSFGLGCSHDDLSGLIVGNVLTMRTALSSGIPGVGVKHGRLKHAHKGRLSPAKPGVGAMSMK